MNHRMLGSVFGTLLCSYFAGYTIWIREENPQPVLEALQQTDKNQPNVELVPLEDVHRVMTISQARAGEKQQTFRYQLQKRDTTPLQIQLENLSCGCLSAKIDGQILQAQDTMTWSGHGTKVVEVSMATPHAARDFKFSFALISRPLENLPATDHPRPIAAKTLSGVGRLHVLPDLIIEPLVSRRSLPKHPEALKITVEQTVLLNQPTPDTPSLEGLPRWLKLKNIRPLAKHSDAYLQRRSWQIELEMLPDEMPSHRQTLTAKPYLRWKQAGDALIEESVFTVMLTPSGILAAEMVVLKADPQNPSQRSMRVPIRSVDGIAFRILRVQSKNGHVKTLVEDQRRSELLWIDLQSVTNECIDDEVTIETDHPLGGTSMIRVIGPGSETRQRFTTTVANEKPFTE